MKKVKLLGFLFSGLLSLTACTSTPPTNDPEALAEYALEKFRQRDYDALKKCADDKLVHDITQMEIANETAKTDAGLNEESKQKYEEGEKFWKENFTDPTFKKTDVDDYGKNGKKVHFECSKGRLNIVVEKNDGKWVLHKINLF